MPAILFQAVASNYIPILPPFLCETTQERQRPTLPRLEVGSLCTEGATRYVMSSSRKLREQSLTKPQDSFLVFLYFSRAFHQFKSTEYLTLSG